MSLTLLKFRNAANTEIHIYIHNIRVLVYIMSSIEINKGISTLKHEFDHVCRKLQTTMIRHAAVGIGSCKIIKNMYIFPYQEINSHKMTRSTTNPTK